MSWNARVKTVQKATGVTGFTGAAPQSVTAAAVLMGSVTVGTLAANVYVLATTNTLTLTGKWQVSQDGTTYVDHIVGTGAEPSVLVTGTGSAVTKTRSVSAHSSTYAYRYARYTVVSGVGVGGGAAVDEASISYNYVQSDV